MARQSASPHASNAKYNKAAWLEASTEVDAAGFRYDIVREGGSAYIVNRVLKAALEREKTLWNRSLSARAHLTTANYDFVRAGLDASGLMKVTVTPKREDELLINGVIILPQTLAICCGSKVIWQNHRLSV